MTETITTPAPFLPFVPTLDGLLAWAEAEHAKKLAGQPSEWDQGHWAISRPNGTPIAASCATACCLAGKTVAALGGRFLLEEDYGRGYQIATDAELPTGKRVNVEDFARVQADALFEADNDIASIRRIVQEIKDGVEEPEAGPDEGYDDDEF